MLELSLTSGQGKIKILFKQNHLSRLSLPAGPEMGEVDSG